VWYTDLVALTDRAMHRQFKDLLSDAGLTPQTFRDAVEHLTGERVRRDRTSRWWRERTNPGPIVRAFLVLVARLPAKERARLLPPRMPD
jgi:hypothetical protein